MTAITRFHGQDEVSRRHFVSRVAQAFLGVSAAAPVLASSAAAAVPGVRPAATKRVIYLYMAGGMSHLDTFDTKPGASTQGPVESVRTSADGVQVSEYLPLMAQQMHHVAVVNSLSTTQGAHEQGNYFMHTSYVQRGSIAHPGLGCWVSRLSGKVNPTLPANVVINGGSRGSGAGWMESKYGPLPIGNPLAGLQYSERPSHISESKFNRRLAMAELMNKRFTGYYDQKQVRAYTDLYDEALRLMSSQDLKAFDITEEPDDMRAAYGNNPFGQGCLLARRLAERDVRFIEVNLGGWDTHDDNFNRVQARTDILDSGMATLIGDLEQRGMLDETLVVLATEFGRTPTIVTNRSGRNHYPKAFTCLLAGGGVRGGIKFGKTDPEGREVVEDKVAVPRFNATIAHILGLDTDQVLHSPSGRPFRVADRGQPIAGLLA